MSLPLNQRLGYRTKHLLKWSLFWEHVSFMKSNSILSMWFINSADSDRGDDSDKGLSIIPAMNTGQPTPSMWHLADRHFKYVSLLKILDEFPCPSGHPGIYFFSGPCCPCSHRTFPPKKTSQVRDQHVDNQIMIPTSSKKSAVTSSAFLIRRICSRCKRVIIWGYNMYNNNEVVLRRRPHKAYIIFYVH